MDETSPVARVVDNWTDGNRKDAAREWLGLPRDARLEIIGSLLALTDTPFEVDTGLVEEACSFADVVAAVCRERA